MPAALVSDAAAPSAAMTGSTADAASEVRRESIAIRLERSPFTQDEFLSSYDYHGKESTSVMEKTKSVVKSGVMCSNSRGKEALLNHIPILRWLPGYSVKDNLIGDCIAGLTVAVMHIPQGMAYALLAGLEPVNGLYMAFFPVLIYMIFSTSKHNSVGTFAVVLLMTGTLAMEVTEKYNRASPGTLFEDQQHMSRNSGFPLGTLSNESSPKREPVVRYAQAQTVALVAFCVGMWQLLMGLLRLGALSVLLSDVLISGLTTGASIHILTSQLKGIFGIPVPRITAFPKLMRVHLHIINHIFESNVVALLVSAVTMGALAVNNDFIKPWLSKRCRFPVPIELIAVVGGTLYSYFMKLHERYALPILGSIPTGIPAPETPPFEIMNDVLIGSLVIAIVAFTTSHSMAIIFSKRLNYTVDANQELLAHGLSNILGSLFQCAPSAASLSRSLIQQAVGGVTQLSSGISAALILVILLYLGPFFENLPKCILSSIIIVSLKGLFVQFADLAKAWRSSKLDALIWFSTFVSVVGIDIDYGLAIGIAVSLVTLLWRNQHAYACLLGEIPNTGIYVDKERFSAAEEIHNVKIFHYGSGLHFANRDYFREILLQLTDLDPVKWHKQAMKRLKRQSKESNEDRRNRQQRDEPERRRNKTTYVTRCLRGPRNDANSDDEEEKGTESHVISEKDMPASAAAAAASKNNFASGSVKTGSRLTEIREIKIDVKSLSGGVTVGDSLALPASTGLRLRRSSIHIDTTGNPLPFRYLLIDLSGISFIDMAGVKLLKSLVLDYDMINVKILFAGTREPVLHMFRKMHFMDDVPAQRFFPTVNDAVVCSKWKLCGAFKRDRLESVREADEH